MLLIPSPDESAQPLEPSKVGEGIDNELERLRKELKVHQIKFWTMAIIAPPSIIAAAFLPDPWGILVVLMWSIQASLDTGRGEVMSTKAAINGLINPPVEEK